MCACGWLSLPKSTRSATASACWPTSIRRPTTQGSKRSTVTNDNRITPMILPVQRYIHDRVSEVIRSHFGVADVPPFAVEVPPTRALGDLAVPVAFQLARTLRKAPRAIAQELADAAGDIPGIARIVATPNGYLNLFLDRERFLVPRVRGEIGADAGAVEKTIVEHTAINPNKSA